MMIFRLKVFQTQISLEAKIEHLTFYVFVVTSRSLKFNDPLMSVEDNTQNNLRRIDKM